MRILFDHGTPAPLIRFLAKHHVAKARDAGWDRLTNGELLNAAEAAGFELLVTTAKTCAISRICLAVAAVDDAKPGSYFEIDIPLPPKKPFTPS